MAWAAVLILVGLASAQLEEWQRDGWHPLRQLGRWLDELAAFVERPDEVARAVLAIELEAARWRFRR